MVVTRWSLSREKADEEFPYMRKAAVEISTDRFWWTGANRWRA